jgi:hypothetical protein
VLSEADDGRRSDPFWIGPEDHVGVQLCPELEALLDEWISSLPEPKPGRAQAIRYLVQQALDDSPADSGKIKGQLNRVAGKGTTSPTELTELKERARLAEREIERLESIVESMRRKSIQ